MFTVKYFQVKGCIDLLVFQSQLYGILNQATQSLLNSLILRLRVMHSPPVIIIRITSKGLGLELVLNKWRHYCQKLWQNLMEKTMSSETFNKWVWNLQMTRSKHRKVDSWVLFVTSKCLSPNSFTIRVGCTLYRLFSLITFPQMKLEVQSSMTSRVRPLWPGLCTIPTWAQKRCLW